MPGSRLNLLVIAGALAVLLLMLAASRMTHLGYLSEKGLDCILIVCAFCTLSIVVLFLCIFERAERQKASQACGPHGKEE
jgi:hypothetical protein